MKTVKIRGSDNQGDSQEQQLTVVAGCAPAFGSNKEPVMIPMGLSGGGTSSTVDPTIADTGFSWFNTTTKSLFLKDATQVTGWFKIIGP